MDIKMLIALLVVWLPVVLGRNLDLTKFYRNVAMANEICVNRPADVVFILDESRSIYYQDFYSQVNFVMGLAPRFNIDAGDIRIGIMTFSDTTDIRFQLGTVTTMQEMETEMQKINKSQSFGDMTETYDAIRRMTTEMFSSEYARDGVARICVLITDGESSDFDRTALEAENARNAGITMFAIGVGKNLKKELNAIANDPDEDFVFEVDNYNALDQISSKLVERTCTIITTTPEPSVEGCNERDLIDLIFSLPDHAGIEGTNYAIEFVNSFVARTNLARVRVGVTPRLCYPGEEIPLYAHDTHASFIMALTRRQLTANNIHKHLQFINTKGMIPDSDNTEQVHRFAILIVDSRFSDRDEAKRQAELAEKKGIHLIVIGVGSFVNKAELTSISSDVFSVSDYSQLQSEIDVAVKTVCDGMNDTEYKGHYDYP